MSLETRIKALETLLGFGMVGAPSGNTEEMRRQSLLIAGLRTERSVGNVLGGQLRTSIGPNSIPIGPYREDVDSTHACEFTQWIPDYQLRITRATIRLQPRAIRSSVAVVAANDTQTSEEAVAHSHGLGGRLTNTYDLNHSHSLTSNSTLGPSTANTSATAGGPTNEETPDAGGGPASDHVHTISTTHLHTLSSHTHALSSSTSPLGSTPHAHTMQSDQRTDDDGAHTHEVEGHDHALELAIAEGGLATAMHLWIDGVDRTTELGGPWSDAVELIITPYLVDSVRNYPVVGPHAMKVTSATVGAIEAVGDIYGVIKAINP